MIWFYPLNELEISGESRQSAKESCRDGKLCHDTSVRSSDAKNIAQLSIAGGELELKCFLVLSHNARITFKDVAMVCREYFAVTTGYGQLEQ